MKQATNLAGTGSRRSLLAVVAALAALVTALFFVVGARPATAQGNGSVPVEEQLTPGEKQALKQQGVDVEKIDIAEALVSKSPDSLSFPSTEVGIASAPQSVTVRVDRRGCVTIPVPFIEDPCVGDFNAKIASAAVSGQGFGKVTDDCTTRELSQGQTCSVGVRFQPNAVGAHSGQLTLTPGKVTIFSFKPCVPTPLGTFCVDLGSLDVATRFTDGGVVSLSGNGLFVDRQSPSVTAFSPTGRTVSPAANVSATFSEAMTQSTLNNSTVKVVKKGTTTRVRGTFKFPAPNRVVLDPTAALTRGTFYTATITTGARDLAGNQLAAQKTWTFKVRP